MKEDELVELKKGKDELNRIADDLKKINVKKIKIKNTFYCFIISKIIFCFMIYFVTHNFIIF